MQVTRTGVDGGRAADLLRTAEAQRVTIPEGTLAELFSTVMQAAGQDMLPGTRRETTAGDLCAFAASLLGLLPTRELSVAVGRAEMAAGGAQVTGYGEQTLARLAPTLHAAVEQLAARLGPQWDLITRRAKPQGSLRCSTGQSATVISSSPSACAWTCDASASTARC